MFKKSLLAAALMIAGGTAANAAEIGVRHTWGTSMRNITHGSYVFDYNASTLGTEQSSGFTVGISGDDFTAAAGGAYGEFGVSYTDETLEANPLVYSEESTVMRGKNGNGKNDTTSITERRPVVDTVAVDAEGAGAAGFLAVDGELSVAFSEYTRSGSYDSTTAIDESYSFDGSTTSGFSELSTFSR